MLTPAASVMALEEVIEDGISASCSQRFDHPHCRHYAARDRIQPFSLTGAIVFRYSTMGSYTP